VFQVTILACYVAAAWLLARVKLAGERTATSFSPAPGVLVGAAGLLLHSLSVAGSISAGEGQELSIAGVASLIGWLLALTALLASLRPRLRGLAAVLLPVAGILALAPLGSAITAPANTTRPDWELRAHILMSVTAYSLLSLGAVMAVLVWLQDRALRARNFANWTRILPPLETMENALFLTIHLGFLLLTLALFSGLIFVDDLFAQHLAHKAVLSMIAWAVFGILLLGRWQFGWRGRKAVHWALAGYGVLLLAYFGSRVILEIVLGRQWG
jgi:ABC-type uncharacterized transport system permease subunit